MSLGMQLNRRVSLQQRATGSDAFGQPLTGWEEVAMVWGSVRDLTGKQYQAAQAAQNAIMSEIVIRFREGVVPAMRAVVGGVAYDIQAVLGTDRRTLTLMVVKGLTNG